MVLVDTKVWSELIRADPEPSVVQWEAANMHLLWLSAVVLAEFRARAAQMADGKRNYAVAVSIEHVVAVYQVRILPFDERCSREFALVLRSARDAGTPIDAADAMIAATARAHDLRLATRNANDFAGAGVELIDPWRS